MQLLEAVNKTHLIFSIQTVVYAELCFQGSSIPFIKYKTKQKQKQTTTKNPRG